MRLIGSLRAKGRRERMSDAELTRFVLREFRMNSITLKRDALEAIVSVVRR